MRLLLVSQTLSADWVFVLKILWVTGISDFFTSTVKTEGFMCIDAVVGYLRRRGARQVCSSEDFLQN